MLLHEAFYCESVLMQKPGIAQRGHRRLRRGRCSIANQIYFVTTPTYERIRLFDNFWLGRIVVESLRREERHANTLAFVVMPDHLHWLLQLKDSRSLSNCVNTVKSYAARRINEERGREGAIWQTGFHDHALRREEDLESVARYIVLNPVRAGLVRSVGHYPLWDAVWV